MKFKSRLMISFVFLAMLAGGQVQSAQQAAAPIQVDRSKLAEQQIKKIVLYPAEIKPFSIPVRLLPNESERINRNAVAHYRRALLLATALPDSPEFRGEDQSMIWSAQLDS